MWAAYLATVCLLGRLHLPGATESAFQAEEAALKGSNLTSLQKFVHLIQEVRNYDYSLPPIDAEHDGDAVSVDVGIYVTNIGKIDELEMDFTLTVYLRHIWVDYRMEFADVIPNLNSIALPDGYYTSLWTPDTFIENGKESLMHNVTQANRGFRVYSNGTVFYSQRVTITPWCPVDLVKFPMDTQTCLVRFMSYRYTVEEMALNWLSESAIEGVEQVNMTAFKLSKVSKASCVSRFSTGDYGCILAEFTFKREFGYYLTQIYAPCILIIALSWVSFWLDPFAVPARITLGVLTVLTMASQMSTAASTSLPKVSYVKAIDIWLTSCLAFLFAAILEFAIVHSLARREKHRLSKMVKEAVAENTSSGAGVHTADESGDASSSWTIGAETKRLNHLNPIIVDKLSRLVFPLAFLVFNGFYWGLLLQS